MTDRIKPLLGALVAGYIVFFVAATYLYQPVAALPAMDPLVPTWLSLAIALVLLVLFFDWMNQAVGNPMKSGIIIAVSQILLVDCLYVLNGNREIESAVASVVVLLAIWCTIGFVYGKLSSGQGSG